MARMLSQLGTTIRGSIGGCTFAANQYHAITVRNRVSPVNPQTPGQSAIRLGMSAANTQWGELDEEDRQSWEDYAASVFFSGPCGQYQVPGRQMALGQQALAYYLSYQGVTDFDVPSMEPPTKLGLLGIGPVIPGPLVAVGTGFLFSITNPNTEDMTVGCWISHRQNDTRYRFKGPWYDPYFHSLDVTASSSGNLSIADLPADGIYFCKLKGISTDAPRRISPSAIYRLEATTVEA